MIKAFCQQHVNLVFAKIDGKGFEMGRRVVIIVLVTVLMLVVLSWISSSLDEL